MFLIIIKWLCLNLATFSHVCDFGEEKFCFLSRPCFCCLENIFIMIIRLFFFCYDFFFCKNVSKFFYAFYPVAIFVIFYIDAFNFFCGKRFFDNKTILVINENNNYKNKTRISSSILRKT